MELTLEQQLAYTISQMIAQQVEQRVNEIVPVAVQSYINQSMAEEVVQEMEQLVLDLELNEAQQANCQPLKKSRVYLTQRDTEEIFYLTKLFNMKPKNLATVYNVDVSTINKVNRRMLNTDIAEFSFTKKIGDYPKAEQVKIRTMVNNGVAQEIIKVKYNLCPQSISQLYRR